MALDGAMEEKQECAEEEQQEKWVGNYCSIHDILFVGEGDFSFSLSLAKSFGSASNIVATSLDTSDAVIAKYGKAKSNLESLELMGATLLHGIDATKMKFHTDLKMRKFDRIVFNFPHAGFKGREDKKQVIELHKKLVFGFFKNASHMLRQSGEVHVSHKTAHPFCQWDLKELAFRNSLELTETVDFKIEDYPGYDNKRGDGRRCDQKFPLGESSTFKFRIKKALEKRRKASNIKFRPDHRNSALITENSSQVRLGVGMLNQNNFVCNGFLMDKCQPDSNFIITSVPGMGHTPENLRNGDDVSLRVPHPNIVNVHGLSSRVCTRFSHNEQHYYGRLDEPFRKEFARRLVSVYGRPLDYGIEPHGLRQFDVQRERFVNGTARRNIIDYNSEQQPEDADFGVLREPFSSHVVRRDSIGYIRQGGFQQYGNLGDAYTNASARKTMDGYMRQQQELMHYGVAREAWLQY